MVASPPSPLSHPSWSAPPGQPHPSRQPLQCPEASAASRHALGARNEWAAGCCGASLSQPADVAAGACTSHNPTTPKMAMNAKAEHWLAAPRSRSWCQVANVHAAPGNIQAWFASPALALSDSRPACPLSAASAARAAAVASAACFLAASSSCFSLSTSFCSGASKGQQEAHALHLCACGITHIILPGRFCSCDTTPPHSSAEATQLS